MARCIRGAPQQMPFSAVEGKMQSQMWRKSYQSRRSFIGGSDARIIMGSDEAALVRLWHEKRGEAEPEDLSGNLIVELGAATEDLNRSWYERNTGRRVGHVQRRVRHSAIRWMAATLERPRKHEFGVEHPFHALDDPGHPKRRRPKSTWPRCSRTCGSPTYARGCCRSSPAGENGWKSQSPWTRSI